MFTLSPSLERGFVEVSIVERSLGDGRHRKSNSIFRSSILERSHH